MRPVVTGLSWMGSGCGSIDSALEEVVLSAKKSLIVLAYRMSDGAVHLMDMLRQRLGAGVKVTMIVNTISTHHGAIPKMLNELLLDYRGSFLLYEFLGQPGVELHAKAIIADERRAIIGSANLSWSGLVANYELSVMVQGEAVQQLASVARKLIDAKEVKRVNPPKGGS